MRFTSRTRRIGTKVMAPLRWKGREPHPFAKRRTCAFLARLLLCFASTVCIAHASDAWTFCVGESAEGHDIWITSVFRATKDRERLETDFRAFLRRHDVPGAAVQCPAPKSEKTDMVNAQLTAVEFHQKLGDTLHDAVVPEFESKR